MNRIGCPIHPLSCITKAGDIINPCRGRQEDHRDDDHRYRQSPQSAGDAPAGYSGGTKNVHRKPVDQSSPSDTNPVMFFCNGVPPIQGLQWLSGLDQILINIAQ